ncbi:suppressor of fused domain protein [Speluncibacter jeojiensis]|uniref:suppressor of fused domain protein n=1 Tax=Speluncibacter jeojiensis TaxID=2710754 RepID=UPI0038CD1E69
MVAENVSDAVRAHLHRCIGGPEPESASVTFLGVESLEVLRFAPPAPDGDVRYVSLGCSRYPMGDPTAMVSDPERGPRAELELTLHAYTPTRGVHRALAVLAATPAVEGLVLVADALLDLGEPLWEGSPFTGVLLGPGDIPDLELPEPRDPVRFFDAVPVTGTEAAWVRVRGADALREAWVEAGIDIRDPRRSSVNL